MHNQAEELDERHDAIDASAEIICFEFADELVELLGGRADSEEERDLKEEDDE